MDDPSVASICSHFECGNIGKEEYLYEYGITCLAIYFINEGAVRHLHYDEDKNEITCDFTFENNFLTDYSSFMARCHLVWVEQCSLYHNNDSKSYTEIT